jgi:heavy metal translocating P-type ATPase
MLIAELLIAGGALYTWARIYQKQKKLKANTLGVTYSSPLKKVVQVKDDKLSQLNTVEETDINDIEEWIDHYFIVSTVTMGAGVAGIWIPPLGIISIIGLVYLTIPLWERSYEELVKQRRLNTGTLESIGIPLLILSGYLPAAAIGNWLYYLGLKFMAMAKNRSINQLTNTLTKPLHSVWIQREGKEIESRYEDIQLGDIVVIQGGEMIPVDGTIKEGIAGIDERMMTGESQLVEKGIGDQVFAFTIVLTGKIWVRVEKTGMETIAAQIEQMLNQTNHYAASVELRAKQLLDRTALPTLVLSSLALPIAGYRSALVVLDTSIVDSIMITGPINILTHLSVASRHGLLIKDGRALELLKKVDTIVFDKTGTLTHNQPQVGKIYPLEPYSEDDILIYAAIAESKQNHPIAKAILEAAKHHQLTLPIFDHTQYELGYGIKVCRENQSIRVGSAKFMVLENIAIPTEIEIIEEHCHQQGYSSVYVAIDDHLAGVIELWPTVRPEAKQVIHQLKQRNLSLYIISGDHEKPTQALAQELGIDHYFAETLPADKADLIEQLQKQGKSVCFIGDGVNDAIALKKAQVSVSLSGASTIAMDTAQVILMEENLNQLIKLFELANSFEKNYQKSLALDVVPNVICIGGAFFFHLGIYSALAIYSVGLVGGVINGILPLLKPISQKTK